MLLLHVYPALIDENKGCGRCKPAVVMTSLAGKNDEKTNAYEHKTPNRLTQPGHPRVRDAFVMRSARVRHMATLSFASTSHCAMIARSMQNVKSSKCCIHGG
jgi:hypothetical protein